MKKIISVILTFSLLAALLPILATEANAYSENIIKVGLYYGSSAMPSANLANEVGDGYNFGWFDSNREFYYIGYTYENKITTMKDTNMYLSGGTYYDSMAPAGYTTIGAYHVDIGESYGTYDDALYAAYDIESETGVNAFPAYINGDYRVRAGSYSSKSSAENAALDLGFSAGFVVGNSSTCYTVTVTSTGEIIFEFDNGSPFGIQPTGTEDTITWFKGYKYRGAFEYNRRNGGDVTVINVVGLTDYVKGVIPYEMNPNWHIECLKAHAAQQVLLLRIKINTALMDLMCATLLIARCIVEQILQQQILIWRQRLSAVLGFTLKVNFATLYTTLQMEEPQRAR